MLISQTAKPHNGCMFPLLFLQCLTQGLSLVMILLFTQSVLAFTDVYLSVGIGRICCQREVADICHGVHGVGDLGLLAILLDRPGYKTLVPVMGSEGKRRPGGTSNSKVTPSASTSYFSVPSPLRERARSFSRL